MQIVILCINMLKKLLQSHLGHLHNLKRLAGMNNNLSFISVFLETEIVDLMVVFNLEEKAVLWGSDTHISKMGRGGGVGSGVNFILHVSKGLK